MLGSRGAYRTQLIAVLYTAQYTFYTNNITFNERTSNVCESVNLNRIITYIEFIVECSS